MKKSYILKSLLGFGLVACSITTLSFTLTSCNKQAPIDANKPVIQAQITINTLKKDKSGSATLTVTQVYVEE
jgi:hypothetical protein